MLNSFVRESAYFQTVRNRGELETGYVFDNQFNNIVSYINSKIVPTITSLSQNKIHGVRDSDGYILRNIGDGSTIFNRLMADDIPDINLDKLARIMPNSIVFCKQDDLIPLHCDDFNIEIPNITLISLAGGSEFSVISALNIEDSTITNDKVALNTLSEKHLTDDAIAQGFVNDVPTVKIQDEALTAGKIADKAYSYYKISQELDDVRDIFDALILVRADVTLLADDTHIIKKNHIANNSISFSDMFGNAAILTNANISPNSVTLPIAGDISPYAFFNGANLLGIVNVADRSFTPRNNNLAADGISKHKLSQAIIDKLKIGGLVV